MTATSKAPRRPRIRARGPPPAPTPIRMARGSRSAAADDRVLAEFLETSLRVPNLTLPPQNRKRFQFPPPTPELPCVAAQALLPGVSSAAAVIAAAENSGSFSVKAAVYASEAREAVEASKALFAAPEEVKRDLGRWFRRRDHPVAGEEFCWFRPVSRDDDRALESALPDSTYREFREKMDVVASKMEDIAKGVIRVLSDNVKNASGSSLSRDAPSILRLTLHSSKTSGASWNDPGRTDPLSSQALSIHLTGNDQQIRLRNKIGSAVFSLPAGSMLVTVGNQIQEWSNGEFKSCAGEIVFDKTDEQDRLITLELLYSPRDLLLSEAGRHARCIDRPKIVAFRDQILVALVLLCLFYLFWN